ncbi:Vacuolar protein sorting protein 72 [Rhynchospora pubera]|uniref:Vacuolar protein sorting protein 72 n=1 Tax=Rhynchospora pubera TaxID=906938 RepID=A0AAV8GTY7_9POAL|nr:Vacuolar protein sorting protein 72 [Rhynchospora pubera]
MAAEAEEDEESLLLLLDRASRATRGKRMTKLLDEELEHDEVFWNQDALKEEEHDDNYEEEAEAPDVYDSDFDEDEPDPDEEAETVVEERLPVKKRLIFPGKQMRKIQANKSKSKSKSKVTKKKDLSELEKEEETSKADKSSNEVAKGGKPDSTEEQEAEKTIRKSTRTSVIVRQAEREAIRAELQAAMKPIKRKKQGEEKRMTQEEMLLEAAETEIMNLGNLERVLAREEEVKKKAVIHKAKYDGPQVRFSSRDGISYLEFSKGASFGSELNTKSASYPVKSICVVTGLPAKYKDPKTGLPYATLEAFKIIRERFEESQRIKKPEDLEMGDLFDSISGDGFTTKHKRSGHANANIRQPDSRLGARFRRIPALDMLDSD